MRHAPRPLVVAVSGLFYRVGLNAHRSIATQRRIAEAGARASVPPKGTHVEHVALGGRPAERVTLGASERPRAIVYLHGGGYVLGSPRMYRSLAAHLSRAAGAVVFNVDYRLAPEHTYPAALDDAVAAFLDVMALGYPAERIAIAGDSAGGGLAVATARSLIDSGHRPAALALLSPWTDPADHDLPERDFVVNRRWGSANAALYRGDADPREAGYAPMYGRLDDLPPMLIHCGAQEMLNAQIKRFAASCTAAGAQVQLVQHARLWHSGHILAGTLREATDAVHDVGVFLRPHLDAATSVQNHGVPS